MLKKCRDERVICTRVQEVCNKVLYPMFASLLMSVLPLDVSPSSFLRSPLEEIAKSGTQPFGKAEPLFRTSKRKTEEVSTLPAKKTKTTKQKQPTKADDVKVLVTP